MSARALLFALVAIILQIQGNSGSDATDELIDIVQRVQKLTEDTYDLEDRPSSKYERDIAELKARIVAFGSDRSNLGDDANQNLKNFKANLLDTLDFLNADLRDIARTSSLISEDDEKTRETDLSRSDGSDGSPMINTIKNINDVKAIIAKGISNLRANCQIIWFILTLAYENHVKQTFTELESVRSSFEGEILKSNCSPQEKNRCYNLKNSIMRTAEAAPKNVKECYHVAFGDYNVYRRSIMDQYATKQNHLEFVLDAADRKCNETDSLDFCIEQMSRVFNKASQDWTAEIDKQERLNMNWLMDRIGPIRSCVEASWGQMNATLHSYRPAVMTCLNCSDSVELQDLERHLAAM
ncbi:uncharacterized protein LOC135171003 [Diachasmimorpha longicaudata]|uniref:uncharacterized protein LOC135171003 n=1 Tax=Diachasmimorpha longicaudata TaxID=58733 RepID=UPI0030B8F7CD